MTNILKKLCIFMLIAFILILPISSFNIPADSDKLDAIKSEQKPVEDTLGSQDASSGTRDRIQSAGLTGEETNAPVQLIKEISPDGNSTYLVNTTLRVRVEAILNGKELNNIQILESVDPSLKVSNISKVYIINNLLELPIIERGFEKPELIDNLTKNIISQDIIKNKKESFNITEEFENDSMYLGKYSITEDNPESMIYYDDNIFLIEKRNILDTKMGSDLGSNSIGKKGRIIFWYNITPKEPGTYKTRTIVRTSNEFPDIDQTKKISIVDHNPRFEVTISGKKTELERGEKLNITYNVKYLGGSSDPFICDVSINNHSKDYEIVEGQSIHLNLSFKLNELKQIYFNVKYPDDGKFYLPDLSIKGIEICKRSNEYTFKGEIVEVDYIDRKSSDIINWFLFGILIAASQIFGKEINDLIKSGGKFLILLIKYRLKAWFIRLVQKIKQILSF